MSFKYLEIPLAELSNHMMDLLKGNTTALLVKKTMSPAQCQVVYDNFINSAGLYQREDGVPALMVGTNTYLQNAETVIEELQKNNVYAELLFRGTDNVYRHVFDCIEDAGYRFRQAYIDGIPAPVYRGTIWNNPAKRGKPLLAHTDWPQVKFSGLEFEHVKTPVAINFYPKHPPKGASTLRLYNLIPEESWLDDLGIKSSGYPIAQEQLEGIRYIDIHPEEGDILLFNAAHVHAVNSQSVLDEQNDSNQHRLNINGFFGFCEQLNRVLAWA